MRWARSRRAELKKQMCMTALLFELALEADDCCFMLFVWPQNVSRCRPSMMLALRLADLDATAAPPFQGLDS